MTSVDVIPAARWQPLLEALAGQLAGEKVLSDPSWRSAFTAVPRHVFVPRFYDDSVDPPRWVDSTDPAWLPGVYSDETLATQLLPMPGQPGIPYVTSSSTRPGYMLWLLHLLVAADDMRVLEIGTGTGYNAALLSQRLGDRQITSIDIDPHLVDLARGRLAKSGFRPRLAVRDGRAGHPEHAPYDRNIATVAVDRIPYAWVQQVRPGGIILADLRPVGMIRGGAIVKLTVHADGTATGRLIDGGVGFMSARTDPAHPAAPDVPAIDKTTVSERRGCGDPERTCASTDRRAGPPGHHRLPPPRPSHDHHT
ncbi:methyltransferase domain-containing protein [Actinomadura sp. KC216]|uniref:methyltransferase domain-containing protein n=1 Tax=Actinomadura sp. KC216 TaxID=2530370 RepID=UPI0010441F9B|nr:methyltransferase domain-containing protein [Actinomadura sp. KC216]TDB82904.1 methyltransferase domain-containing protein [Actinomadura sp. KC216]